MFSPIVIRDSLVYMMIIGDELVHNIAQIVTIIFTPVATAIDNLLAMTLSTYTTKLTRLSAVAKNTNLTHPPPMYDGTQDGPRKMTNMKSRRGPVEKTS